MSSKDNSWDTGMAGLVWGEMPDGFRIVPVFSSEKIIEVIDKKIEIMDRTKMIITVVEREMDYTVIFYEDPEEKIETKSEFLMAENDLQGDYSEFKKKYDPSKKIYFTYEKRIEDLMQIAGIPVDPKPRIVPFQVKKFRIIKESDLRLDEFKQQSTTPGFIPDEFEYRVEARIILKDDKDGENLV